MRLRMIFLLLTWPIMLGLTLRLAPRLDVRESVTVICHRPAEPDLLSATILADAKAIWGPQTGAFGITPVEVLAWRLLLQSEEGGAVFEGLAVHGTLPAKLYGLAGLWLLDRDMYDRLASDLRGSRDSVFVGSGGFPEYMPVASVLSDIERGIAARELMQSPTL